ncbi:pentatricopeptide repeat-containing protein At4g02820, mitochondrial-like isoform X2 [Eucalyptus grandis]|uniref:pentatricopeptide repeat-containing protein At4g02820, mitochondrial-like isoform X2 n=1 Tax=Eucalyptus grandis TaxID=71139 RepID=UPI00192ECFAE|nr:pentatricopeptide repeat-containing protein At4g02820, mitochondrial-like isoform X2 [Eucalyptus grandis]
MPLRSANRRFSAEAVAAESPSATATASSSAHAAGTAQRRKGGDTLGKRLLSLVYAKRSAVVTIRKWKEEGGAMRKYELNRIVRELRKLKRYKHALECREVLRRSSISDERGAYLQCSPPQLCQEAAVQQS